MYDENFEQMREEAIQYDIQRNRDVLERWCKEAGIKEPVGYARDYSKKTYTIYTRHPGCLIGMHGDLAKKYTEEIKKMFPAINDVIFVEINGGFANYS